MPLAAGCWARSTSGSRSIRSASDLHTYCTSKISHVLENIMYSLYLLEKTTSTYQSARPLVARTGDSRGVWSRGRSGQAYAYVNRFIRHTHSRMCSGCEGVTCCCRTGMLPSAAHLQNSPAAVRTTTTTSRRREVDEKEGKWLVTRQRISEVSKRCLLSELRERFRFPSCCCLGQCGYGRPSTTSLAYYVLRSEYG